MLEREEHIMPTAQVSAFDVESRDAQVAVRLQLAGEVLERFGDELHRAELEPGRRAEIGSMLWVLADDVRGALERP